MMHLSVSLSLRKCTMKRLAVAAIGLALVVGMAGNAVVGNPASGGQAQAAKEARP